MLQTVGIVKIGQALGFLKGDGEDTPSIYSAVGTAPEFTLLQQPSYGLGEAFGLNWPGRHRGKGRPEITRTGLLRGTPDRL